MGTDEGCGGAASAPGGRDEETAEAMRDRIEAFLRGAREPALFEYGDDPFPVARAEWSTEIQSGRLLVHVLTAEQSLSRRVLSVEQPKGGLLGCVVERFGGKKRKLSLIDLSLPQAASRTLRGRRISFGERFRRMLQRQFPGWEIAALSAEMDLSRSLSPVFPRAVLERNGRRMAAMACPPAEDEGAMLTFALIWHQLVRQRRATNRNLSQAVPLQLFLPDDAGVLTAQRLRWLRGGPAVECRLYRYNEHGAAGEVDPADLGNLETEVRQRKPGSGQGPGSSARYRRPPEAWLETVVRAHIQRIDARLLPDRVYGEVLTRSGVTMGRADLLAITRTGELAVLELKASEDMHLPLQGLDYWACVHRHASRGELDHLFTGIRVSRAMPRLLLVAPALCFHPSTGTVLEYFSPDVQVERVGIGLDWRREPAVAMRLPGAAKPMSQG